MPARGRSLIDYKEAERLYVIEGKSLRSIATELGLKSNASISAIARRDDWNGKRLAYDAAIARRSYEVSAATVADQGKEIRDEAVLAGRATIRAYLKDLAAGNVKVNPRDAQAWAAFLMSEAAAPRTPSAEAPDVRNVTPPDTDHLRRVVELARGRVAPSGGMGSDPLVEPPSTRPN
jgi:hypothetical protein